MKKVVINTGCIGLSLSHAGMLRLAELKNLTLYPVMDKVPLNEKGENKPKTKEDMKFIPFDPLFDAEPDKLYMSHYYLTPIKGDGTLDSKDEFNLDLLSREDKDLIKVLEQQGDLAKIGLYNNLEIVEIPNDASYIIERVDNHEQLRIL